MKDNDLIISGNNLPLTDALKATVREKMQKLFDHETTILRIRVELSAGSPPGSDEQFAAKGIIEIKGRDLIATVRTDDLYKCIDLLENKLDRMLRRRSRLRILKRKQTHSVEIPAAIPKAASM